MMITPPRTATCRSRLRCGAALLCALLCWPTGCVLIDDDPPGGPDDVDWPPEGGPGPGEPETPPELRHTPYTHLAQIKDWEDLPPVGADIDLDALVSWAAGTPDVLAWRVLRRTGTDPWRFEFEEGGSAELLVPGIVRAFELEFGEEENGVRQGTRIVAPTYADLFVISYVAQEVLRPDDGEHPGEWPPLDPPPPDDPFWDEDEGLSGKIDVELLEVLELEPWREWVEVAIDVEGVHALELNAEAARRFAFHNDAGATLDEIREEILDAHERETFDLLSGPMEELRDLILTSAPVSAPELHPDVLVGTIDVDLPVSLLHEVAELPWVKAIWWEGAESEEDSDNNDWGLPPLTRRVSPFGFPSDQEFAGGAPRSRIRTFRRHGIDTFHRAGLSGNSTSRTSARPMRVGILDAGIAPQHQAWLDRAGRSRVTDLWNCGRNASCRRCSLDRTSICGLVREEHGMTVAGLVAAGIPWPRPSYPVECVPTGQSASSQHACCSLVGRRPHRDAPFNCLGPHVSDREHRLARTGVAPDAELLHAAVGVECRLSDDICGSVPAQRGGLEAMLRRDVMAVGTSISSRPVFRTFPCPEHRTPALQRATESGINAGVAFFSSAGNDGRLAGNRFGCTVQRPSVYWSSFAVGNARFSSAGVFEGLNESSSRGPRGALNPTVIELVAPGDHPLLPQTRPPSAHPVPAFYRAGYQGGTSHAQPFVTGTYILLREFLKVVGSPMEGEVGAILTYLHATAQPFISQEEPYPYNEEEGAGLVMAVLPDPTFGNLTPPFDIHMSQHRVRNGRMVEVVANPDSEGKGLAMPISGLYNRSVHAFWRQGRGTGDLVRFSNGGLAYLPRVMMNVNLLAPGEEALTGAEGHASCSRPHGSRRYTAPGTRDYDRWRIDNKGRVRLGEQNTRGTCQVASFRTVGSSSSVYYTRIFTSEPEDTQRNPAWVRFVNLMPPEHPPVRVEVVQETGDGRWTSLRTRDPEPIRSGMMSAALPVRASMEPIHFRADWSGEQEAVTTGLGLRPNQEYTVYLVPECDGHDWNFRWSGRLHVVEEDRNWLATAWSMLHQCNRSPNRCREEGVVRFLNAVPFDLRAGVLDLRMWDVFRPPRVLSPVLEAAGTLMPGDENVTSAWMHRHDDGARWSHDPEQDRVAMMTEAEQSHVTNNCVLNPFCPGTGPPPRMNCDEGWCNHHPDPLAEILGEELLEPDVIRRACTISPTIVRLPQQDHAESPPEFVPPGGVTGPLPDLPEPIIFPPSLPPLSPFPPFNAPGFISPIQTRDSFVNNPCTADHQAELDAWNREIRLRVTCAWPERPELP